MSVLVEGLSLFLLGGEPATHAQCICYLQVMAVDK